MIQGNRLSMLGFELNQIQFYSVAVMLIRLRTFRLLAASLAVTLLFGSMLPLVQHACAMVLQQHQHMGDCDQEMAAADHHAMMQQHEHPASSEEPMPCYNAEQPRTMVTCCFLEAAAQADNTAPVPRVAELQAAAYFPAQSLFLPEPDAHPFTRTGFDTGPPRASSLALHLLHAAFLI